MPFHTSMLRRMPGRARIAALAIAVASITGVATTARADSHFDNGFEDQLGRILAFEVVQAGKALLFQGVAVPVPGPVPAPAPAYYAPPVPVPVAVPVAVPTPYYYQPVYAVRAPRPVVYYPVKHGRGHYHRGHDCD